MTRLKVSFLWSKKAIALSVSFILSFAALIAFITGKTNLPDIINYLSSYTSSSKIEPVMIVEKQKPSTKTQNVRVHWDESTYTEDEFIYLAKQLNLTEDQIDFLVRKVYVRMDIVPSTVKQITLTLFHSESKKRIVENQVFKTDSMLFLSHGVYKMSIQAENYEDYEQLLYIKKSTIGEMTVPINLIAKH